MTIRKSFKIDIYDTIITVIVTDNVTQEEQRLYDKHKLDDKVYEEEPDGFTLSLPDGNHCVVLKDEKLSMNLLAHEIYHLTNFVTRNRGIHDEEAQAWLMGYLFDKILTILQKEKVVIKNGH